MKGTYLATILLALGLVISACEVNVPDGPENMRAAAATASSTPIAKKVREKAPATFTLNLPGESLVFTQEELLNHQAARTLTVGDQGAFKGQQIPFRAVPVTALFQGKRLPNGLTVEFAASDGFSASLDPELLLNSDPAGSRAYLAVEEPGKPWPRLGKGGSAGPFYLIWENPQLSNVGQEQWPYQLASFSLKEPVEKRFPGLLPDPALAKEHPARNGFQLFTKNCFACHTLNGEGSSTLGPDLNLPHSPTEYMQREYLRKLVRDPQSLRRWKGSRMSSFSEAQISNSELDDIIAYLEHKAAQRRQSGL